jgi:hypothetical protein
MGVIMKWFRDVNTGKVGKYPARFGARFANLEEISEDESSCADCMISSAPEDDEADATYPYVEDYGHDEEDED